MGNYIHSSVRAVCAIGMVILLTALALDASTLRIVKGTITDIDTHAPVAGVTVQIPGTGVATSTNDQGQFRLLVSADSCELKFSHIAYYSERIPLRFADSITTLDLALHSAVIEVQGQVVSAHDYDAAQRIILEAIKRKKDILSRIHDYHFDAYTKLLVRDLKKPDSTNIFLLTETQVSCFWEQPDKYKEVITARRQSANISADNNLVTVGQILNFNKNRIDIADYQVVSPTATDALDSYNYYLIDTVEVDGRRVFVLEVEPKSQVQPLFEGTIHIADSTFDVVAVDVGFNKGFRLGMLQNPRYSQRFAQFEKEYWMPIEIRFSGRVKLSIPIPGFPSELSFAHVASLYGFSFETGTPKGTFNEYSLQVSEKADDHDTLRWNSSQVIPLTDHEANAYRRIDSIKHAPKPLGRQLLVAAVALPFIALTKDDFFHFNRVEGAYLGIGGTLTKVLPHTEIRFKTGYALSAKYWQHNYGVSREVWHARRVWGGISYSDEIVSRPTVTSPWGGHMTIPALFAKQDPFDYYYRRGFSLTGRGKLLPFTTLRVGYHDYRHRSAAATTDFSLFNKNDSTKEYPATINGVPSTVRENPSIVDGTMRTLSASLTYDSRKLIDSKGRDFVESSPQYLVVTAGTEIAAPDFIANDFSFKRYSLSVTARHAVFGLGASSVSLYAGTSSGTLPPQKYFSMPFGTDILAVGTGFQTLQTINFGGSRVASILYEHDFDRLLWGKSGLPLIKRIPFTLSVHGGAFWSDFKDHPLQPGDERIRLAPTAYTEVGFSIGNLTPFMNPFNLALQFTWQVSAYDTHKFSLMWGFKL
jgi:hypothetical protein